MYRKTIFKIKTLLFPRNAPNSAVHYSVRLYAATIVNSVGTRVHI
jgi:hypothetical protein